MDSRIYRGAGLALCTAALALAGCGGDDGGGGGGGSDEDAVRQAVTELTTNDPAACDNVTDGFLKKLDSTKAECREAADGEAPDPKPEIDEVSVEEDTAEVIVLDEDRSTVALVKEGGDWLIDDIEVEEGAGKQSGASDASGGSSESGDSSGSGGDDEAEIAARGTADAFLKAIRDEDKNVFCGILSERYAHGAAQREGDGRRRVRHQLRDRLGQAPGAAGIEVGHRRGAGRLQRREHQPQRRYDAASEQGRRAFRHRSDQLARRPIRAEFAGSEALHSPSASRRTPLFCHVRNR